MILRSPARIIRLGDAFGKEIVNDMHKKYKELHFAHYQTNIYSHTLKLSKERYIKSRVVNCPG